MRAATVLLAAALLAGCATTSGNDVVATGDPLERFNRGMWAVNQGVDRAVIKPAAVAYRTVTPRPARRGLIRLLSNLGEPFSAINNLLQGNGKRALRNLERFVINTTIGVGGLADHATDLGVPSAYEDFGQTMAAWGVGSGPYLVLPLFGPSTVRDGVGIGVGFVADPYQLLQGELNLSTSERIALIGLNIVNARSSLTDSGADGFLASSLDPYAASRAAFLQRRRLQILNEDGVGRVPSATDAAAPAPAPGDDPALDAAVKEAQDAQGAEGAQDAPLPTPSTGTTGDPALDAALRELQQDGAVPPPEAPAAPPAAAPR